MRILKRKPLLVKLSFNGGKLSARFRKPSPSPADGFLIVPRAGLLIEKDGTRTEPLGIAENPLKTFRGATAAPLLHLRGPVHLKRQRAVDPGPTWSRTLTTTSAMCGASATDAEALNSSNACGLNLANRLASDGARMHDAGCSRTSASAAWTWTATAFLRAAHSIHRWCNRPEPQDPRISS